MNCIARKGEDVVFQSQGKRLHPLFELECATETALTDGMTLDEACAELAGRAGRL